MLRLSTRLINRRYETEPRKHVRGRGCGIMSPADYFFQRRPSDLRSALTLRLATLVPPFHASRGRWNGENVCTLCTAFNRTQRRGTRGSMNFRLEATRYASKPESCVVCFVRHRSTVSTPNEFRPRIESPIRRFFLTPCPRTSSNCLRSRITRGNLIWSAPGTKDRAVDVDIFSFGVGNVSFSFDRVSVILIG